MPVPGDGFEESSHQLRWPHLKCMVAPPWSGKLCVPTEASPGFEVRGHCRQREILSQKSLNRTIGVHLLLPKKDLKKPRWNFLPLSRKILCNLSPGKSKCVVTGAPTPPPLSFFLLLSQSKCLQDPWRTEWVSRGRWRSGLPTVAWLLS